MKTKTFVFAIPVFAIAIAAYAHQESQGSCADEGKNAYGKGGHMGMMSKMHHGGGMMMHHQGMHHGAGMDHEFDIDALTEQMQLSNEQIVLLTQMHASHLQMQAQMYSAQDDDHQAMHERMMANQGEYQQQMAAHRQLYEQFAATLSETQKQAWQAHQAECHQ